MAEEEYSDLISDNFSDSKDAKFNMFRFQDHLLRIIGLVCDCFLQRDYPSAFEELQNLYIDTNGFYSSEETTELNQLYEEAYEKNIKYITYNINYQGGVIKNIKNHTYNPPPNLYQALIRFRFKLMKYMCKHQLLIPQVSKSQHGAGSQA